MLLSKKRMLMLLELQLTKPKQRPKLLQELPKQKLRKPKPREPLLLCKRTSRLLLMSSKLNKEKKRPEKLLRERLRENKKKEKDLLLLLSLMKNNKNDNKTLKRR